MVTAFVGWVATALVGVSVTALVGWVATAFVGVSVTALVGISDRKEEACRQKCMRCTKTDCPFRAGPAEVLREP
mgnify:CR=1 FL=1